MKQILSASDINKYCYCPAQFYYTKKYGPALISKLYREKIVALGYEESALSQFDKGKKYHDNYKEQNPILYYLFLIFFICFFIWYLLWK